MTPDSIQVSIPLPVIGTHTVTLQVRVVGSIGQAVTHRGAVRLGSGAAVLLFGRATWIEDENAYTYIPSLGADTYISQSEAGFNFGGAASLVARTGTERRPLLQFGFGPIPLPPQGADVHAAYLELWPTLSAGSSVPVSVHRLRASWTEGHELQQRYEDGLEAFGRGDFQAAIRNWRAVWIDWPEHPSVAEYLIRAYLYEGIALYSSGKYEAAIELCHRVLEIDASNAKAKRYLQRMLEEKSELQQIGGGNGPH